MNSITKQDFERVYKAMQTPYKKGWALWEKDVSIDCATVFWHKSEWRMIYARHDARVDKAKQGYETWMARSSDLLNWQPMGRILSQTFKGWDGLQCDGGIFLLDTDWQGTHTPAMHNGKYYMGYIGGALPGYEPDPLHIGLATCTQLDIAQEWQRMPSPILSINDTDVRDFERNTLYKSTVIYDKEQRLNAPYVMYYNAKGPRFSIEEIGIAVSNDMISWRRYADNSVVKSGLPTNCWSIAGDPQIIRFEDLWVMHYFVAHNKAEGIIGYDTFALSKDLLNWQSWKGAPLIEPSEKYDNICAHKPYVLCHDGVVYHYYCAVGDEGRGIAVATSKP